MGDFQTYLQWEGRSIGHVPNVVEHHQNHNFIDYNSDDDCKIKMIEKIVEHCRTFLSIPREEGGGVGV